MSAAIASPRLLRSRRARDVLLESMLFCRFFSPTASPDRPDPEIILMRSQALRTQANAMRGRTDKSQRLTRQQSQKSPQDPQLLQCNIHHTVAYNCSRIGWGGQCSSMILISYPSLAA